MDFRFAKTDDIDGVLQLQQKYHISSISEEDKKDGFVTTLFTKEQLTKLITEEQGLSIAVDNDTVVAYAMAASWQFWSSWPFFVHMIEGLKNLEYVGLKLDTENSYQYGPVCVDKKYRGSVVLAGVFELSRKEMSKRFKILITFINKINPRSYNAHVRKLGLDVISEFEFNNNKYFELAYDTSKKLDPKV